MLYLTFALYLIAGLASQFLTSTPFELFTLAGVAIWMPLSALTIVPLVDVLRSFTQHHTERAGWSFRKTFLAMFASSTILSGLAVIFGGLPLPIFVGVLAAVTIGGAADILVFRHVGKWFKNPVSRMVFSNFAATFIGSGIVFLTAFTDIIFSNNPLAMPYFNAMVGWLAQSTFIWASSVGIGTLLQKFLK